MATSLTLSQKLKLALEWAPAIQMVTAIGAASPGQDRALAVVRLLEWLAVKSETPLDDDLTKLVKAILLTKEGAALVDYLAALIQGAAQQASYEHYRLDGV